MSAAGPRESRPPTLVIGHWSSSCGECGQSADCYAETHARRLGYNPGIGCGVRWTHVTAKYMGEGEEEGVRNLRPDLTWIAPGFRP